MCTVTFLKTENGFLLTSNRDEWVLRKSALIPQSYEVYNQEVVFPKDPQAGGTWIAAGKNYTLCLLNGAFIRHESKPPYLKSRGIMLLDFFKYDNVDRFISEYSFIGIENFTLLLVENFAARLTEIRWDGTKLHTLEMDVNQPHIWSSATLYTDQVIKERKDWFASWLLNKKQFFQQEIIKFHRFGGKGNKEIDFMMNREDKVKTVSITSIQRDENCEQISYLDVLSMQESILSLVKK